MRLLVLLTCLTVAAAACGNGIAKTNPDSWAGLTKPQAISKAANGILGLTLAFKPKTSPALLQKERARLDAHTPKTRKVTCSGERLWQVTWPKSGSIYVSRKAIMISCQ